MDILIKIGYILLALAILLVLITIHECGHYVAGKVFGFKINEFAIGFGPKLYKKVNKKTGEVFSIRLLPLGGFCAFEGEDEENPSKDAFNNKAPWKRIIVLLSGVLFNFIFGVITAAIFLMVNGYGLPVVSSFSPNNPNAELLQPKDKIIAVDGKKLEAYRLISDVLAKYKEGQEITITVERDGKIVEVSGVKKYKVDAFYYSQNISGLSGKVYNSLGELVSDADLENYIKTQIKPVLKLDENGKVVTEGKGKNKKDVYEDFKLPEHTFYKDKELTTEYTSKEFSERAKVALSRPTTTVGFIYYNTQARYGFFESCLKAWPFSFYICKVILVTFAGLFTGATALSEVGGTLTSIGTMAELSAANSMNILALLPMLALNLAVFNILPIPALDGAQCIFVLIEWIFRKPVPRKVQGIINTVGLFVLLGLVLFLDIYHIFFMRP